MLSRETDCALERNKILKRGRNPGYLTKQLTKSQNFLFLFIVVFHEPT